MSPSWSKVSLLRGEIWDGGNSYIKIRTVLDNVWVGGEIVVINPDTGGVLDGHAIVVKNTGESQVLDDDVGSIDESHAISRNRSILATDDGFVCSIDAKTSWQSELSFDDDGQGVCSLEKVRLSKKHNF